MNRVQLTEVAGTIAGAVLGLLLAFQAGAQGQSGGARPGGVTGGATNAGGFGNTRIGIDRSWPRGPEVQAPSRLPEDKAFGEKGEDASEKKDANASSAASASAQGNSAAEAGGVKAEAAIAAAGTGGTTGKGQGSEAGVEGRATAAAAVSAGTGAEIPANSAESIPATELHGNGSDRGRSAEAPGHTGQTGLAQATLRADEHADAGLEKAQSNQETDDASDVRKEPEAAPPQKTFSRSLDGSRPVPDARYRPRFIPSLRGRSRSSPPAAPLLRIPGRPRTLPLERNAHRDSRMQAPATTFIPQRHPEHTLPDQRPDRVVDQVGIALVDKTVGQSIDQSDRFIGPPEQQRSGIRTDRPAIKRRSHHPAPFYTLKLQLFSVTLCRHRILRWLSLNSSS